jgi:hypothetical protein
MQGVKVLMMNESRNERRDPLNLGELPEVQTDFDGWPEIESALRQENRKRRARAIAGGSLAAAATVVLALAFMLRIPATSPLPDATENAVTTLGQEAEPVPLREPAVESLIAMSQQLENRIRAYRARVGDLPSDALVFQVELQDLVAQVDSKLSVAPDSAELWSQRVNLLLDLSQLYENSLRRDYYRMASL